MCGMMSDHCLGRAKYFLIFKDDYSSNLLLYLYDIDIFQSLKHPHELDDYKCALESEGHL